MSPGENKDQVQSSEEPITAIMTTTREIAPSWFSSLPIPALESTLHSAHCSLFLRASQMINQEKKSVYPLYSSGESAFQILGALKSDD